MEVSDTGYSLAGAEVEDEADLLLIVQFVEIDKEDIWPNLERPVFCVAILSVSYNLPRQLVSINKMVHNLWATEDQQ